MISPCIAIPLLLSLRLAYAEYTYRDGRCRDGKEVGMNVGRLGPCADLRFSSHPHVKWSGHDLVGADLSAANLMGADLSKAKADFTGFNRADLRLSSFAAAELKSADLRGARLDSAHFDRARAPRIDLRGVKASGATFTGADLSGARLMFGFFNFCDFSGADLRGADFSEAVVIGTNFSGARFDQATRLPFGRDRAKALNMTEDAGVKK